MFSGKIYTAGKIFNRPLVVTVVTNFKSASDTIDITAPKTKMTNSGQCRDLPTLFYSRWYKIAELFCQSHKSKENKVGSWISEPLCQRHILVGRKLVRMIFLKTETCHHTHLLFFLSIFKNHQNGLNLIHSRPPAPPGICEE